MIRLMSDSTTASVSINTENTDGFLGVSADWAEIPFEQLVGWGMLKFVT